MNDLVQQITHLYIGYLGRAADQEGLNYWVHSIESEGASLDDVRKAFTDPEQAEYQDIYGGLTREALVIRIYSNLFERDPDGAGQEYWINGEGSSVEPDRLIEAFLASASEADQQVIDNKQEAADYYTELLGDTDGFSQETARDAISTVDGSATSLETAKAAIDTIVDDNPGDGEEEPDDMDSEDTDSPDSESDEETEDTDTEGTDESDDETDSSEDQDSDNDAEEDDPDTSGEDDTDTNENDEASEDESDPVVEDPENNSEEDNESEGDNEGHGAEDLVILAGGMVNSRASNDDESIQFDSFLNIDLLDERGSSPSRLSISALDNIPSGTANTADVDDIPAIENADLFKFDLGSGTDTIDYSNETGTLVALVDFDTGNNALQISRTLVSFDGDTDFSDDGNRGDLLTDVEVLVAASATQAGAQSIVDLSQSPLDLTLRFNPDEEPIATDTELDRDIFRLEVTATNEPGWEGLNFHEYYDAGNAADITQLTAGWTRIEGSDADELVELTDQETVLDHTFNLRGGDNEVNYNELTRHINTTLSIVEFDTTDKANTGIITAVTTFTDGSGNAFGGTDTTTSYAAQNTIAIGSLRLEGTQDSEDSLTITTGSPSQFLLGAVFGNSDLLTVTIGSDDRQNEIVVSGYEILRDSTTDDTYQMADLARVQDNLRILDSALADTDTLIIQNDAIAYDGGPGALETSTDTISLEVLNDIFGFDFNVLDARQINGVGITISGDDDNQDNDGNLNAVDTDYVGPGDTDNNGANDLSRDIVSDRVILGDLDAIDSLGNFAALQLTDTSIASSGSEFILDMTGNALQDGSASTLVSVANSLTEFDASLVATAVNLSLISATAFILRGGSADDRLNGGTGDDQIIGGNGNDLLEGGVASEVRGIQLSGSLAVGNNATFDFMGQGNITFTEGTDFTDGADADQVGTALASQLDADLTQVNADWLAGGGDAGAVITGIAYDSLNNLVLFTFAEGLDVANPITLGFAPGGDTGNLSVAANSTETEGSDGGQDTYLFVNNNGADTISNFTAGAGTDSMDFSLISGISAGATGIAADASGTAADGRTFVFADGRDGAGTEEIEDYQNLSDVAGFLQAGLSSIDDSHNYVAVINDHANSTGYVYLVDPDTDASTANQIDNGDLALIATVEASAALTVDDIV